VNGYRRNVSAARPYDRYTPKDPLSPHPVFHAGREVRLAAGIVVS